MHNASPSLAKVLKAIDRISIVSGKIVAWMILPMSFSLVYEVVARYVFNAPTIWASDVSQILYGMFFMLGSAYALQRQQHIRTDFLYGKWSARTRGLVDATCYIGLYFPASGFFPVGGKRIRLPFHPVQRTDRHQPLDADHLAAQAGHPHFNPAASDPGRVRTPQKSFRGDKGREPL